MEAPIFTLATKPDLSVWHWESKDKSRSVTVTPSVLGRATQHDKDLLIYVVSQMTEALNRGRLDASHRTVRFRVYDYLVSTNKPVGGIEYRRLQEALERLRGTSIKTNIKTGGERVKEGFGILDTWKIIEKAPDDDRMIGVEVTLSKWLFNAVQANEVLTINADYFRLRKPIERRLYELARKHCGAQPSFTISLALLQDKCGSKAKLFEFRRMLREIVADNLLPDYQLVPDWPNDQITIRNRSPQPLLAAAKTTVEKA
jgi:plasmid replication initiation protein